MSRPMIPFTTTELDVIRDLLHNSINLLTRGESDDPKKAKTYIKDAIIAMNDVVNECK